MKRWLNRGRTRSPRGGDTQRDAAEPQTHCRSGAPGGARERACRCDRLVVIAQYDEPPTRNVGCDHERAIQNVGYGVSSFNNWTCGASPRRPRSPRSRGSACRACTRNSRHPLLRDADESARHRADASANSVGDHGKGIGILRFSTREIEGCTTPTSSIPPKTVQKIKVLANRNDMFT